MNRWTCFFISAVLSASTLQNVSYGQKLNANLAVTEILTVADGLVQPFDIDFGPDGTLYVIDYETGYLWSQKAGGRLIHCAGAKQGHFSTKTQSALDVLLKNPHSLAVHNTGVVYVADSFHHVIRAYDPKTQLLSTFAGTGEPGFSGDGGEASLAQFNETYHINLSADQSRLLVTDLKNRRLRVIELESGIVSTLAGNGERKFPTENAPAARNPLYDPRASIFSTHGIFLLDRGGHLLMQIDPSGNIHTLAGERKKGNNDGLKGVSLLNGPKDLCLTAVGNVIIADTENHAIRHFNIKTGMLTTLPIDGLKKPHGVCMHDGVLSFADSGNGRLLQVVLPQEK